MSTPNRRPAGILGRLVSPVVDAVDPEDLLARIDVDDLVGRIDINALLDRIDVDHLLDRIDIERLLARLDANQLLATVDLDVLLTRLDLNALIGRLPIDEVVAAVDLNALVARLDTEQLVARLDVQRIIDQVDVGALIDRVDVQRLIDQVDVGALIDRVDVQGVVDRVDVGALVDGVDIQRIVDRVDVNALVRRVDVQTIVDQIEVGGVVGQSAAHIATGTLGGIRAALERLDAAVMRVTTRGPSVARRAGPLSRLAAWAVDSTLISLLFSAGVAVVGYLLELFSSRRFDPTRESASGWAVAALAWSSAFLFFSFVLAQRTPGMGLVGIHVEDGRGDALTVRSAFLRVVAFPFSFVLGIGFVGVVFGRSGRALHDIVAGTVVVHDADAIGPPTP